MTVDRLPRNHATARPTGTVTFLFTDVEGSTQRWVRHEAAMAAAVARHDRLISEVVDRWHGYVFATAGDSFAVAFADAESALGAAGDLQRALAGQDWRSVDGLRVRVGIHTGTADERDGDYFGPQVSRAARIMAAAHGGQVLVSAAAAALAPAHRFARLGSHRLRDLPEPEELWQLLGDGLQPSFPPLRGVEATSTLPAQSSSFVGRERELVELQRLLHTRRLVTLTGIGGTGKTRLAVEAAARAAHEVPDGVYFVDLSAVSDPDQLPGVTAAGLRLRVDPVASPALDQVLAFLAHRQALLVLDNCEHVVDAVAELLEALLVAAPGLRVLATSREPIDLDGEHVLRVPSLAVDEDLSASPAVRLFLERAAACGGATARDADLPTVAELCRRLDGIPLALELAAARTRVLSPEEVLAHLDDRFALLTGGRRRSRQRQQTLQAALDWSYDLLPEHEQQAFRYLAAFPGRFDLGAASAVLGAPTRAAVELLDALVAKSMLTCEQSPRGARYRLLETLRAYGQAKLAGAGEAAQARQRHLESVVGRASLMPHARAWQSSFMDEVEEDYDNLLAALDWAAETGQADHLARLMEHALTTWQSRSNYVDARRWTAIALRGQDDPERRGWLLLLRAWTAMVDLDLPTAVACDREAVTLAKDENPPFLPLVLTHLGLVEHGLEPHRWLGLSERAVDSAQRSRAAELLVPMCLVFRGYPHLMLGDLAAAAEDFREGGRRLRELGWDSAVDHADTPLAVALAAVGQADAAREIARRPLRDPRTVWSLANEVHSAVALAMAGDPELALTRLCGAADRHGAIGVPLISDTLLTGFAVAQLHAGRAERGRQLLSASVGLRTPVLMAVHAMHREEHRLPRPASLVGWANEHREVQERLLQEELRAARDIAGLTVTPAAG